MTVFNIPIREVCRNFDNNCIRTMKIEKFCVFCLFRCQFQIFFNLKTAIISSKKTTGQQTRSLTTLFNIPIYEVCRKFDKNCLRTFENWKILFFLSFSVSIWYFFHLENSNCLFGKAYWTTNSCHNERFQHPNPRSLFKI